jgi:uncharacterized protein (DUF934 family)
VLPDRVIRHGAVEPDLWTYVGVDPQQPADAALPPGPVIVPLSLWKARRAELAARPAPVGVWLGPDDDPLELSADVSSLLIVAVHFPKFTDGRGYSTAVLLRTRLGYRGELRAFGDVGRDQLFYLKRCGFDSFRLASHRDPEAAIPGLETFSLRYQGSVDDPQPLFRKRLAGRREAA